MPFRKFSAIFDGKREETLLGRNFLFDDDEFALVADDEPMSVCFGEFVSKVFSSLSLLIFGFFADCDDCADNEDRRSCIAFDGNGSDVFDDELDIPKSFSLVSIELAAFLLFCEDSDSR